MRIAYMLTSLGIGGAERQVIALAERIATRGHEVALVVLRERAAREWPTQLPLVRLRMARSMRGLAGGVMRGRQFLRGYRPDILHSHTFPANMAARAFRAMGAVPAVLCTIHNVYEGGRFRTIAYRTTDWLSTHTTAVSHAVANRYAQIGAVPPQKLSVVTNGIDLNEFSTRGERGNQVRESMHAEGEFVWLAAGRIVPAKDFENLLSAFRRVREVIPSAQLWIAGGLGEDRVVSVNDQVIGSGHSDPTGVRWLGHRDDMPEVLSACDAFVLSSAWEGLPLVVGEAMAMEKPVAATDVGGVSELVGDAGVVVPAKDPQALADAMLRVMEKTREERAGMGRAARLRIGRYFEMNAKAAEWERLYTRLLGDERQRSSRKCVIT